jgi:hypothetical protein
MKQKCHICGTNVTNIEKHLLSKKHLNQLEKKKNSDKIKDCIKYILQNREEIPTIEEIINDCDINDTHDLFVTNAIVEFLQCPKQEFIITDENIEIIHEEIV